MGTVRFSSFASTSPETIAVVDDGGEIWTRSRLAADANRLSRALRDKGLAPGDVLAILAPNCAEYLMTYLAASQIGLYVVPVNWHLAPPEIRYILENAGAKALVVHQRLRSSIATLIPDMASLASVRISLNGDIPGFVSMASFSQGFNGAELESPVDGRVLSYTSATTGKPKGVLLPLEDAGRVLDLGIERRMAAGTLPEQHVFLCHSMLYHGSPLENAMVALHMGQRVVLTPNFSPETLLQLIEKHAVTQAFVVPTLFVRLLQLDDATRARYTTSSLRRIFHGGTPCPPETKQRMIDWWGNILWESYGATEGSGTIASSEDWLRHPGTVGRPILGTRLMIIGEDGEEAPTGSPGLVYMTRYSGDRFAYLGDPEKTAGAYRGDYFTVGDIGYLNDEGYLFICDRKIDMISLGGVKVYPAEIEQVYLRHPHVADCAVIGVPDPVNGEAIVAFVQPSASAPPPRDLRLALTLFLCEHLSAYKLPRHIKVVADLGRDVTGKIQKKRLRERYLSETSVDAPSRAAAQLPFA